jgi:hypothetical protein
MKVKVIFEAAIEVPDDIRLFGNSVTLEEEEGDLVVVFTDTATNETRAYHLTETVLRVERMILPY